MLADAIWLFHTFVLVVALFGWLWPAIHTFYILVLALALLSNIFLGYCFLSKWEFDLRKRANPKLRYDYPYTSYYTYRLTRGRLSRRFLRLTVFFFTSISLLINFIF